MRRTLTALSIMALVVCTAQVVTAADTQRADLKKAEGEVVLISPAVIRLNVDGNLMSFDRTPSSKVDDAVSQGEQAVVWYEQVGTSLRVTSVAVSHSPGSTAARMANEGRESNRMQGNQNQAPGAQPSEQSRQGEQGMSPDTSSDENMSYVEYQRRSREQMTDRDLLPQTASHVREVGLAGLLLLVTGAGLVLWTRRS